MSKHMYSEFPMALGNTAIVSYAGNYPKEIAIVSKKVAAVIRGMNGVERDNCIKSKKVLDIYYPTTGHWPDWMAFYKDTPHAKNGIVLKQSDANHFTFIDCALINFNKIFKHIKQITPGNARLKPYWGFDPDHPAGRELELKSEVDVYAIETAFQSIRKTLPDCKIMVKKSRKKKTPLQLKIIASI